MRTMFLAAILVLTGCHRAIGEDGSNASADAQHLGAINTGDHARQLVTTGVTPAPVAQR
jgi:hypothetical protein